MPGDNTSTANLAAVGAALAALLVWALGLALPQDAMGSFPDGPFSVIITWGFCRFVPTSLDPGAKLPPAVAPALLALFVGFTWPGCSTSNGLPTVADLCGPATQTWAVAQDAAILAMTSPAVKLSDEARDTIRRMDSQAVDAIDACATAARIGDMIGAQAQADLIQSAAQATNAAVAGRR